MSLVYKWITVGFHDHTLFVWRNKHTIRPEIPGEYIYEYIYIYYRVYHRSYQVFTMTPPATVTRGTVVVA